MRTRLPSVRRPVGRAVSVAMHLALCGARYSPAGPLRGGCGFGSVSEAPTPRDPDLPDVVRSCRRLRPLYSAQQGAHGFDQLPGFGLRQHERWRHDQARPRADMDDHAELVSEASAYRHTGPSRRSCRCTAAVCAEPPHQWSPARSTNGQTFCHPRCRLRRHSKLQNDTENGNPQEVEEASVGCQTACHLSARRPGATVALPLKCRPSSAI